jgi:hypothetical protein
VNVAVLDRVGDVDHGQGVTATCTGDGLPLLVVRAPSGGSAEFSLRSERDVELRFELKPAIGGQTRTTLALRQQFVNNGATLRARAFDDGRGTGQMVLGAHPLVALSQQKGAKEATFVVRVDTTFVDVTGHYFAHHPDMLGNAASWAGVLHSQEGALPAKAVLRLLILTTSVAPMLWYALVPGAASKPGPFEALTFFRPVHPDPINADDPAPIVGDPAESRFYRAVRFTLNPSATAADFRLQDAISFDNRRAHPEDRFWPFLPCRFARVLEASGKRVPVLMPVAHGNSWGAAAGAELPRLMARALHTLGAGGLVDVDPANTAFVRPLLGLMAFSSGGPGMWQALDAAPGEYGEVWSFEAVGTREHLGSLARAAAVGAARAAIVGFQFDDVFKASAGFPALAGRVRRIPPSPSRKPADLIQNPELVKAISGYVPDPSKWTPSHGSLTALDPTDRTRTITVAMPKDFDERFAVLHQFSVFGGDAAGSFFDQCLTGSSFT